MAGLLDIGVSGLLSFQNSLNTTGHNIANSDTEGYSRQRTQLATRTPTLTGAGWVGTGVKVAGVQRMYDNFLATQVRSTQSVSSELEVYSAHATIIDDILADPNIGLDPAVQGFFDSMQQLADDPSSIATRQLLMSETHSMVDRFHGLSRQFTDMRDQLNQEMSNLTTEINGLAESIGRINQSIVEAIGASGGNDPNDLLDQREVLLGELAEKVDISLVPQDDGAWNIFIGKGQALVMGSTASTLSVQLSVADVSEYDIAFTDFTGTNVITDQLSGGEIGGLLSFRDEILNPGQNQLGLIAVGISDRLNAQHQLGLDLNGDQGGRIFSDPAVQVVPNGNNAIPAPTVTAQFVNTGNLTASDYQLEATAAGQFQLTRLADNFQFPLINTPPSTTTEIDGFSLTISGAATTGDKFLIRPTRNAAELMTFEINDARKFSAAAPLRSQPAGNTLTPGPNLGNGAVSQPVVSDAGTINSATSISLVYDSGSGGFNVIPGGITLAYDPVNDHAGKSFTISGDGDPEFTITGTPQDGDSFVIEFNSNGIGDNRNALLMAELQHSNTLLGSTSAADDETATFQDVYAQLVADVGSKTHNAQVNSEATDGLLERHQMALSSISGVNLDEEAANLIKYQQAYQASAQMIGVANTLFDTLLGAVRG